MPPSAERLEAAAGTGEAEGREAAAKLAAYEALLRRWGARYNLVSRGDLGRLRERHIDDSLALLPWCEGAVVDVGSGAGLPGVPLAIGGAELTVTLLERSERKCAFLRHVVQELGLSNATVVQVDARRYGPAVRFDTGVARAVAPPPAAWRLLRPLLAPGGRALLPTRAPLSDGSAVFDGGVVWCAQRAGYGWVSCIRDRPRAAGGVR